MIKNHLYWSFAGVYSDIGSGTRVKKRSGLRSMLYACRRGKIDMILVKSAQRFARNTTDGLKVIRMLRNKNIDIYFEQGLVNVFLIPHLISSLFEWLSACALAHITVNRNSEFSKRE